MPSRANREGTTTYRRTDVQSVNDRQRPFTTDDDGARPIVSTLGDTLNELNMRKFFKSSEGRTKQLIKDRLRKRYQRRLARAKLERELKPEIERISANSKLAEVLASLSKIPPK